MRRRNIEICIRLNDNEYNTLKEKTQKAGISYSEFFRRCITSKEIKEAPPADVPALIMRLRNSQLLFEKAIHTSHTAPTEELLEALHGAREAEQLIAQTYNMRN